MQNSIKGPRKAVLYSRITPMNLNFLKKYSKKKGARSVSATIDTIISEFRKKTPKK
jgi:hypothetical protein